jgi:hypothetical protein
MHVTYRARVSSVVGLDPCRQDRRLDPEHLPITVHVTQTIFANLIL